MTQSLTFLGGVGTVTGSKHLVQFDHTRILVDCGLFQGLKALRLQNWAALPVSESSIDEVVLTHAHLDHSGYLPALIKHGYRGKVRCTEATADLCAILLPDSGHLQEQDADFLNRHGHTKHHPALPLYTENEAERAVRRLHAMPFHETSILPGGAALTFRRAGHILGAATVELKANGRTLVFSGDLGRYDDPLMLDPEPVKAADYLLVESTYGNRRHDRGDATEVLGEVIRRTAARGGTVVIPAFAVGRTQAILWHLNQLRQRRAIPDLPIYLDSPMAQDVTDLYGRHADEHRLSLAECRAAFGVARFTRTVEESKSISHSPIPKVIVSASGMATGGRVVHHLKAYLPDDRNTVVLAGFQAAGTRGASLAAGAPSVKMHGYWVPVRAEVVDMPMLSAHADCDELMRWLSGFEKPPRETFVTHGEPEPSAALAERIRKDLGWSCRVPDPLETVNLA